MVGVGINENVIIMSAVRKTEDDKNSLVFEFRDGNSPKATTSDPFDQLAGDTVVDTGSGGGNTIRMWPPLPPLATTKDGAAKTQADMAKEASDALGELKNSLIQILSCYTTTENIKFNMFQGMDGVITRDNYSEKITEKAVLDACFVNLADQFVNQMQPFFDKEDCMVRLLLVRQSKEKHYASFRTKYVRDNPFIELGIVPKASSALKFTKYELTQGLNDGTPTASKAADAPAEEAPTTLSNIFNEGKPAE